MILPNKHTPTDRALLGVGGEILTALATPKTVSALWDDVRTLTAQDTRTAVVDYKWFILAVDLLYMLGAVELANGVLRRRSA